MMAIIGAAGEQRPIASPLIVLFLLPSSSDAHFSTNKEFALIGKGMQKFVFDENYVAV